MNPRQRRGVLLLLATGIGAVLVFVALALYTSSVAEEVGPKVEVPVLTADVGPREMITPENVAMQEIPQRWAPRGVPETIEDVLGKVAVGALGEGEILQASMITVAPSLPPGYREVAIMVDAETGVAGKVQPNDRVDIIATTQNPDTDLQRAEVWVPNALVVETGVVQDVENTDAAGGIQEGKAIPITFALSTPDALRLAYAESFAVKLRLALRGPGDMEMIAPDQGSYDSSMPVQSGTLPAGVLPAPEPEAPPAPEPPPASEAPEEPAPEPPVEQPADAPDPEQPAEDQPSAQSEEGQ